MARKTVRAVALFLAAILISQVFPLAALADEPEEIFESYRDTAVYYGLKPESDPTELKKELTYQDFYEIMSRFASLKNGMTIEEFANAKDISVALNGSNVPRDLAIYLGVRSYISMPPEGKMLQDELADMLSEYLTKVVAPLPAMTYYADSQYRRYNFVDGAPLASSRQFVQEALLESVALSKGDSAESGTFSSGSTITREQFICAMYIIACSSLPLDISGQYPGGTTGDLSYDTSVGIILDRIITTGMTEEQKVKAVYDYLSFNSPYSNSSPTPWTSVNPLNPVALEKTLAQGALFESGRGGSAAFACAFRLLLLRLGIQANFVSGTLPSNPGASHNWNQAKVSGEWFWFDTSLENQNKNNAALRYSYYMKKDDVWKTSHNWDASIWPQAIGTVSSSLVTPSPTPTRAPSPTPTPYPTQAAGAPDRYVYQAPGQASLPFNLLDSVSSPESAQKAIDSLLSSFTQTSKADPNFRDLLALFAERAISKGSASAQEEATVSIGAYSGNIVEEAAKAEASIASSGVVLDRKIRTEILYTLPNASNKIDIIINPGAGSLGVSKVRVESPFISVVLPIEFIAAAVADGNAYYLSVERQYLDAILSYKTTSNKNISEQYGLSTPSAPDTAGIVDSESSSVPLKKNPSTNTSDWFVYGNPSNNSFTFRSVDANFTDLSGLDPAVSSYILQLSQKGIISGIAPNTFAPSDTLTRAQAAQLFSVALSILDKNADGGFSDIKPEDWMRPAVGSAKNNGIIAGYEDQTFRPEDILNKEQLSSIAARSLVRSVSGVNALTAADISPVSDAADIADWAKADIALAWKATLIPVTVSGKVNPQESVTRADAAYIIGRLFDRIWL